MFHVPLRKKSELYFFFFNILQISIRYIWGNASFKAPVSLLILCLDDLYIVLSGVWKASTVIVLLLISPLILVNIFLIYWSSSMLDAYTFVIFRCSSWTDHFIIMWCPSMPFIMAFKVYFNWYEYCYSCFILISVCMGYFFFFFSPATCFQSVFVLGLK